MNLSEELIWRGFVHQTTFKDLSELDGEPRTFYWGVDPSAQSMQIGNLAAAMMAKVFMRHGWKAVLLVGGATGLIGDPDGKKQERDLKTIEQITSNKQAIAAQYATIFEGQKFTLVDNYDWFRDLGYLDVLRTVGKHVPMRQMLGREFIQTRLGEDGAGISYAEFSYVLIQAYDFLQLHKDQGVTVQLAASDQWGNCIAGVDLTRRITGYETHVFTMPLVVNKTTGIKFGKTESGAIWLDPVLTSPFDFYQFWLNSDDSGVESYLKLYTSLDSQDMRRIMEEFDTNRGSRAAQRALAYEVTKLIHGEQAVSDILEASQTLFSGLPLDAEAFSKIKSVFPLTALPDGAPLYTVLVQLGLATSNTEARRFLIDGAITINNKFVPAEKSTLDAEDYVDEIAVLRRGKNSVAVASLT